MIEPAVALGVKIPYREENDWELSKTPFPIEAFPDAIQEICHELKRVTQAPIEFSASVCLGVLSASLGKGVVIPNAFRGMRGLSTLQIALALESGSGKTTVFNHVLAPFVRWSKEQREINKANQSSITGQIKLLEKDIQHLTSDLKSGSDYATIQRQVIDRQKELDDLKKKSLSPEYRVEDITLEAMAVQIGVNGTNGQESVFSVSDDARQAISTLLGRYSKNGAVDDNLLVKGFSWSPHQQHRRSEGGSVNLDSPCVVVLWCLQPDLLEKLIGQPELLSSGFLQRFILDEIFWPAEEYTDPGEFDAVVRASWDHLVDVLLNTYRMAPNPHEVQASAEAKQLLLQYRNSLVGRVNDPDDLKDVRSFADRWAEWAWRLSLLFHVVLHRKEAIAMPLAVETAQNALLVTEYYAEKKLAVLSGARLLNERNLNEKILNYMRGVSSGCVSVGDLIRARIAHSAEIGRTYLDRLVLQGDLKKTEESPIGGGPLKIRYYLKAFAPFEPATNATNEDSVHDSSGVRNVRSNRGRSK